MFKERKRIGKKGVEWELGKIAIAVVILIVMIFGIMFLLKGKGGELLASFKNLFRFGR